MLAGEEDDEEMSLRDRLKISLEQKGQWKFVQRVAHVPDNVLKMIDGKSIEVAAEILDKEGY